MYGTLTSTQREYVLFHLRQHIELNGIGRYLTFSSEDQNVDHLTGHIIFKCTSTPFRHDGVKCIEGIPVLFPLDGATHFYYTDANENLVFPHDILKSAFYLLSGYQEYENAASKDQLGRFSFEDAVQNQHNFIDKPIVNYYFAKIIEGIEQFCEARNIRVEKKRLFTNFGFILSHDVDSVDLYTKEYVLYKIKEILHLKKSQRSTRENIRRFVNAVLKYLGVVKNDNPHWNFEFMRELERAHNFRSVFYFLDTGVLHSDAYYTFDEQRILDLFQSLKAEGCEIGLHGPVRSINDQTVMQASLRKLEQYSGATIVGSRQHRLLWRHPETAIIQSAVGLKYDSTLGFAAHEGFRNSYCYPFKLYDFAHDRPIDIWEYPLNVMDVTLFAYRQHSITSAMESIVRLLDEVRKFGGVFSVLWHNSFFDEGDYPGITEFYRQLLGSIARAGAENTLGIALLDKLETSSVHG